MPPGSRGIEPMARGFATDTLTVRKCWRPYQQDRPC
jgi:hypothetical protein